MFLFLVVVLVFLYLLYQLIEGKITYQNFGMYVVILGTLFLIGSDIDIPSSRSNNDRLFFSTPTAELTSLSPRKFPPSRPNNSAPLPGLNSGDELSELLETASANLITRTPTQMSPAVPWRTNMAKRTLGIRWFATARANRTTPTPDPTSTQTTWHTESSNPLRIPETTPTPTTP